MQRFKVLNFVGWVIEIIGWIICAFWFVVFLIVLASGTLGGAAAGAQEDARKGLLGALGGGALGAVLGVIIVIIPLWGGLVTIAAGQIIRVQVVIARGTQETVVQISHLRRTMSAGLSGKGRHDVGEGEGA